jgi:adenylate cyclase
MIGDEVMFVADDPMAAAEICLSLQEVYATQHTLSVVRAGLSYGTVLARGGDYFGTVVNLASRIVNIANPGTLLISETFRGALDLDSGFHTKALRPRYLKDFGEVQLWVLRRSVETGAIAAQGITKGD